MSDLTPNPTDEDLENEPEGVRNLRARNKELADEAKAGAAAKRELAFLKAGVDTDSPMGQFFLNGYDGDLTPEAIKAKATELGVIAGAPDAGGEGGDEVPEGEADQTAERRALHNDSAPPEPTKPGDPARDGLEGFKELRKDGMDAESASVAYFGSVMTAAANGDQRYAWTEQQQAQYAQATKGDLL